MNATKVRCTELRVDDQITEVDTPDGPFYRVAKVNPKSILLDIGYGDTVRLPIRATDVVLRRPDAR